MTKGMVTVYITTHNRRNLVSRSIDSVLSQTYNSIELIVVIDGSTDKTYEHLLSKYKNYNLIIINNEYSLGACVARNMAINKASGEYITGLDDDDYFKENRIEYLVENYIDDYIFLCDSSANKKPINREIELKDILKRNIVGNQVITKTDNLKKIGGFDENLPAWQDYDVWIRLLSSEKKGKKIKGKTMLIDGKHSNDRISNKTDKILLAYKIFMKKHQALYSKKREVTLIRKINTCTFYNLNCSLSYSDIRLLLSKLEIKIAIKYFIITLTNRNSEKKAL